MNIATGEVFTGLDKGRTGSDILRIFQQIDATVPRGLGVHVVPDNLYSYPLQAIRCRSPNHEIASLHSALPGSVALRYTTWGAARCRGHADPVTLTAPASVGPAKSSPRPSPGTSAPKSTRTTRHGPMHTDADANDSPNAKHSP